MTAKMTFFPVGNADTTLIELANERMVLCDYADKGDKKDPYESRIDLPKELRKILDQKNRNYFDVVAFSHLDDDHIHGFSDFFHLEFADKYQTPGRIKIKTLWVPAAAITEEGCDDYSRTLRDEARYRLKQGKGIRVFSRPEKLRDWLHSHGIRLEDRASLITDAGKIAPDFELTGEDKAEFFIHSPFGWRLDENRVEDRNNDSLCFQVTFAEGSSTTQALFFADCDYDALGDIVDITRKHKNDARLRWDIYKSPHHGSYLSIGEDKGIDVTSPTEKVKWLLETQGQSGGVIVSSCNPTPIKGSDDDKSAQPPHRQALNYYSNVKYMKDGKKRVTMEFPNTSKPKPSVVEISVFGAALIMTVPMGAASVAANPARAGRAG